MKLIIFILIIVFGACPVSLELSGILKTCRDDCRRSPDQEEYFFTKKYRSRLYKYVSAGFPAIFWESVRHDAIDKHKISPGCLSGLKSISDGIVNGKYWAYQFLDSSGKSPSGMFQSTLSSFGNYDECLQSSSPIGVIAFRGKCCSVDIFPSKRSNKTKRNDYLDLGDLPAIDGFPFVASFCIPSSCNERELRVMLQQILKEYMFTVNGFLTCDTESSISFLERLRKASILQWISILILSSIIGLVLLATLHDVECFFGFGCERPLLRSLSAVQSLKGLFLVVVPESETLRRRCQELFKMFVITCGTVSHIFVCLDTPISYFVMDRHKELLDSLKTVSSSIINEAGLNNLSTLGGFGTFMILFPFAKKRRIPFAKVIFDRWLRYVPSIICLTALEFLFPFFSSGPLWTRLTTFFVGKCHDNYFLNFFFIQNWIPSLDICAGHTYYSAMDLQLFILGLVGITLFVKNYKLGLVYSTLMIIISNYVMVTNSIKHNLPSSLAIPNPTPEGVVNYLDYLHMNVFIYMSSYFIGYITGWFVSIGFRISLDQTRDHVKFIAIFITLGAGANYLKALHGNLRLLPTSWAPWIIFINRNAYSAAASLFFVYVYSLPSSLMDKRLVEEKEKYNIWRGLTRLTYSVFMSNYLFIRTGFFSRTVLYPIENLPFAQHVISMYTLVVLNAVLFHLFFIGPFDTLRRHFTRSKDKTT